MLEKQGCEVMTAIDGVEAFAMFKEHEFDMVVSDVDMPRMSPALRSPKRSVLVPVRQIYP